MNGSTPMRVPKASMGIVSLVLNGARAEGHDSLSRTNTYSCWQRFQAAGNNAVQGVRTTVVDRVSFYLKVFTLN